VKRLPILSKVFLMLVCFAVALSAYNSASLINNNLIVPYAEFAPILDGVLDAGEYPGTEIGMFIYGEGGLPGDGPADFSGYYRVCWNEDGWYFFGHIIDDTINTSSTNSYENDCFEVYFDGDNSKGSSYDANDVQWRYVYGVTDDSAGWKDNGDVAWAEVTGGYDMELAIPVADLQKGGTQLFDLTEGTVIGWEVQVADNDTGPRNNILKWWNTSNMSWQQPVLFGTAVLGGTDEEATQLEIVEVEFAPTLDGELDADWSAGDPPLVPEVAMPVCIGETDYPAGGYNDFASFYRVAWNADGFYFFGRVVDDIIYTDGANSYEQDCFEIYFDGDNSKGSSYDANDIQWRYVYGVTDDSAGWKDNGDVAWAESENGWNLELSIPVADLQKGGTQLFDLTAGTVIGWEVQTAENDGDGRDLMNKWWSESNMSWQQPALFGTAVLVEETSAPVLAPPPDPGAGIAEPAVDNAIKLSVSSVVSSIATVSYELPVRSSVGISVINIAGQVVATLDEGVKDAGAGSATIDASGLANGVYLIKLSACGKVAGSKILVIK
jgi:hypothetical protein